MSQPKVRIGILGTASIARALIGQRFNFVELAAIASREIRRAHEFGDAASIPLRYASYEELLDNPAIDAVYIPLPQHLHCEYVVRAAQAKKHIIVEKPAALTAGEVTKMAEACKAHNVFFMEAFMYRFMRVHNRAKELVQQGTIGKLRFMNFAWSHNIENRGHDGFRLERNLGGGCLLDLGVYGADWIRFVTDGEPQLLQSYVHRREEDGLDLFAHATYAIGDVLATMTCGYTADANYYFLSGEKGSVYSPVALSGRQVPNILHIHLLGSDSKYSEEFPAQNPYTLEMEYFAQCILNKEQPFLDAENSRRNLLLIEELAANAIPV